MKHLLPALPYDHTALEPHIDPWTMMLHHGEHHATYVANLNHALEGLPELQARSALSLLLNSGKIPQEIRTAVLNNAGGHVNHSLFWWAMAPPTAGGGAPKGPLADAIDRSFGSFEEFKASFVDAGDKQFGSGWVWLTRAAHDRGELQICTTCGHDNPLVRGLYPILLNDVWEHAYYLKYENRRRDYLRSWWAVANWEEAARRFERSDRSAEQGWEDEGGSLDVPTRIEVAGSHALT